MRFQKALSVLLVALLLTTLLPAVGLAAPKATSAKLSVPVGSIDIASSKTLQLEASVLPEGASQSVIWKSSNTSIATVSASGLVTAKKTGKVTIYVRPSGIAKTTKVQLVIKDSAAPSSISVRATTVKLKIGESYSIEPTVKPATASQEVKYKSSKTTVAKVTQTGIINAYKAGTTTITITSARNKKIKRTIKVVVSKLPAPKKLVMTPADSQLIVGKTLQLAITPSPASAASGVKFSTSDKKIAKVSSGGLITPLRPGKVKITATSTSKTSVRVARTFTVIDPYTLTSIAIDQGNIFLDVGGERDLTFSFSPSTAVFTAAWSSSNTSVASVDQNGRVTAKAAGSAVITVKSSNGKTGQITAAVIDRSYAISEPERNTPVSALNENLAKIDAIKTSALAEIDALTTDGSLSQSSAAARKNAITNAFTMYHFPWMTDKAQNYWSSTAASKQYKPGVIYYGMPYIQRSKSSDTNRRFTVERALNGGYFVNAGAYYKMSQSKKLYGTYVGNDCSSFVNMAIFGTSHAASFYRTGTMAVSPHYKTIKGAGNMLPGDLLVKANDHTVMFLYYTNSAKTHMMIIEQGGGNEPNTIAGRHKEVKRYTSGGYIIRRPTKY